MPNVTKRQSKIYTNFPAQAYVARISKSQSKQVKTLVLFGAQRLILTFDSI